MARWKKLRDVFKNITGEGIRKTDNHQLFQESHIETETSGHEVRIYDGKKVYNKRKGAKKWELYSKWKGKGENPMEEEMNKAKEKFSKSATKQIEEAAKQILPQETSANVRRNIEQQLRCQVEDLKYDLNREKSAGFE